MWALVVSQNSSKITGVNSDVFCFCPLLDFLKTCSLCLWPYGSATHPPTYRFLQRYKQLLIWVSCPIQCLTALLLWWEKQQHTPSQLQAQGEGPDSIMGNYFLLTGSKEKRRYDHESGHFALLALPAAEGLWRHHVRIQWKITIP